MLGKVRCDDGSRIATGIIVRTKRLEEQFSETPLFGSSRSPFAPSFHCRLLLSYCHDLVRSSAGVVNVVIQLLRQRKKAHDDGSQVLLSLVCDCAWRKFDGCAHVTMKNSVF